MKIVIGKKEADCILKVMLNMQDEDIEAIESYDEIPILEPFQVCLPLEASPEVRAEVKRRDCSTIPASFHKRKNKRKRR